MKRNILLLALVLICLHFVQSAYAQIPASKKKCSSPPGIPRLKIKVIKDDTGNGYHYILRFSAHNAKRFMVGMRDSTYPPISMRPSWDYVYLPWGVHRWVGTYSRPSGTVLVHVSAMNACGASLSPTFYVYKGKIQKKVNNPIRRSRYVNIGPFPEGVDSVVFRHYKQKKNGAQGRH
jgi:hypothetical protein